MSLFIEGRSLEPLDLSLMNDQELMHLLLSENLGAWSEIVKRYGNLVYSIAYQILKNSSDTDDAVQNTFIRLKIYSKKFDQSLPLKPWLSRIASGEAIRLYNQKKTIHKKESGRMETQNYAIQSPKNEVSHSMEQKELEAMVKKAIELLPDLSRVAVTLYFVGGMNQTEIAEELGVSQFSISEKINSGLNKIKAYLKKSGVHASVALSPSLLQESISSQTLPVALTEKLTHSFPSQLQIATIEYSNKVISKSIFKKLVTSIWFLVSSVVVGTGVWYWSSPSITEKSNSNLVSKNKKNLNFLNNVNDKIFKPVALNNYIPVTCKFVQFTKNDNLPDILEGETQILGGDAVWKIISNKDGSQRIIRDSDKRDVLDGLYLNEDYYQPQVFSGTLKVNTPRSKISFIMSTPMKEVEFKEVNAKKKVPMVYSRRTSNVSAIQADKGNVIDFLIYLFPYKNKLLSISFVHCQGFDYKSVVTKQLEFVIDSSFKFGVISNGKVELLNFNSCNLGKTWDYRQEQNIQESMSELPKDFLNLILDRNTENKIR